MSKKNSYSPTRKNRAIQQRIELSGLRKKESCYSAAWFVLFALVVLGSTYVVTLQIIEVDALLAIAISSIIGVLFFWQGMKYLTKARSHQEEIDKIDILLRG